MNQGNDQAIIHDFGEISRFDEISPWRIAEVFNNQETMQPDEFKEWFRKQPDAKELEEAFPGLRYTMNPGSLDKQLAEEEQARILEDAAARKAEIKAEKSWALMEMQAEAEAEAELEKEYGKPAMQQLRDRETALRDAQQAQAQAIAQMSTSGRKGEIYRFVSDL